MRQVTIRLAVLASLTLCGREALAQQAAADAPGTAQASAGGGQLQEITITAEKRTENLENVPVAASVVSADELAANNVSDISDLNKLDPSVELNGTINGRVPMGIRGVSSVSNEGTVGISSGVAVEVDGVPVPSDSYDGNDIMDVQRVEILKGPQGTLGGRSAASGLINLVTRGPTSTPAAGVDVTATDDGEYRVNTFLSGPLSDRVEGSLAAYKATIDYPITDIAYDRKTSQDLYGYRGKLKFKVSDDLSIEVMAHQAEDRSRGFNFVYLYVPPGATLIGASQAQALPGITPSWRNLDYNSPVTSAGSVHIDSDGSATVSDRLPNGDVLSSTTAYQRERQVQVQDLFADAVYYWNILTPNGPPFGGYFYNTQSQSETVTQLSEELKLVSPADQPLSYLAGAFYSDTKVDELYNRGLPPAQYVVRPIPDTATYDLYGRATWKFAPRTSLVTGLRFNHDELSYHYTETINVVSFPTQVYGPLYSTGSSSSNALVGDVSLQQQIGADSMAYLTYSRGYSPEVYNTSAVLYPNPSNPTQAVPLEPVGQEHIDNFEIGTKGTYFDRRLMVNLDAFYTIYKDYQIQTYSAVANVLTPPLILESVGKAQTRGIELDTRWAATDSTRVGLDLAYIDATFKDYPNAPCWGQPGGIAQTAAEGCTPETITDPQTGVTVTQGVQNLDGTTMPNSPKFKATLSIDQRLPLRPADWQLSVGGEYSYRSSAQMLLDQNPWAVQGAFGILNLRLGAISPDGRYSVSAFMDNVTNHPYYVDVEDFWTGPWGGPSVIGEPARDAHRYYGLTLSARF
jgi:iron complex outermembrane receptor protein